MPDGEEWAGTDFLLPAMTDRGLDARWVVWDDADVDWSEGLVAVRSTWDYATRRDEFVAWAEKQDNESLDRDASPGRTSRAILYHVVCNPGYYLTPFLGAKRGFSRLQHQTERGEVPIIEAFRTAETWVAELLQASTPEQRSLVEERPNEVRTLRKVIRHVLEHDWEHLRELSRRPGGPQL